MGNEAFTFEGVYCKELFLKHARDAVLTHSRTAFISLTSSKRPLRSPLAASRALLCPITSPRLLRYTEVHARVVETKEKFFLGFIRGVQAKRRTRVSRYDVRAIT